MLWLKTFHVFFVIGWSAALFYAPRIFVNLALEAGPEARLRLTGMAKRLLRFGSMLAVLAIATGAWLAVGYGIGTSGPGNGWFVAKLVLVFLVVIYHGACLALLRTIAAGANRHGARWFRVFNEVPAFLFLGILALVIVKPF